MTVVDNVFPQSGDADFAENFATWLGRGNISSYVETGLNLTVDYASSPPTVDISEGKSYVILDQSTISSNSETRLNLDYAITTGAVSGLAVNEAEDNNLLYLNPNIGVNDSPSFEVETSTGNAGANWLLIGVIDTVTDTTETRNRNPDADFGSLTSRNSFSLPVYSELSAADSSEASVVFIDGNGSDKQGVYVDNGTEFITVGVRQISELTDVTGVDSINANSGSNRPAAGTAGRVFIDTSGNSIQFDTGSAWVDIGTNPSNIGAGDLGFNTATQSELDTHIGEIDAHHTPPSAGDGLRNQSNTFNIKPADFSGSFLSDDGTDNIEVNIGNGLVGDGSNNITLTNDSVTISAGDNISGGGTVSLGESVTLNATDTRADVSDDTTLIESNVTDINFSSNLDVSADGDGSVRVDAASSTDTTTDISENGTTVVNQTTDINFEDNIDVVDDGDSSVTVNAIDTIPSVDDSGSFITNNASGFNFGSNLSVTDDGGGNVTIDASDTDTNTTTDISKNGTTIVNQTSDINFTDSGGGSVNVSDETDGTATVNIDHADTSSQATLNASAGAAITDVTLDEYGHITGMSDTDFDSRFVRESGDSMSGQLTTTGVVLNNLSGDGNGWTIQENSSGNLEIGDSVSVRMKVDQSGNVDVEGELTEGTAL